MIMEFGKGKFKIITDERQFITQERKTVKAGKLTKAENVGTTYYESIAYTSTIDQAITHIATKIVLRCDDFAIIMKELDELKQDIKEFSDILKVEVHFNDAN